MALATVPRSSQNRREAVPISDDLQDRLRACLAGDWSRAALSSFGVGYNTLLAALAGAPCWPGTHALLREALAAREQPQEATGGA